jgi:hypothetical protein
MEAFRKGVLKVRKTGIDPQGIRDGSLMKK